MQVDVLRALRDFLDTYDYPPAESVIVESIANSLDEKATNLELFLDTKQRTYSLKDNGAGMSKDQFSNYHILALSRKEKGEGIGFAGVGSKIYLAASNEAEIRTHTCGIDGQLASRIYTRSGKVEWESIKAKLKSRGTLYEVRLTQNDFYNLTENLEDHVKKWYNAILLSYYGKIGIKFRGKTIRPWKPTGKLQRSGKFRFKQHEFEFTFWLCDEDLPQYKQGIEIIVFGKRIKTLTPPWIYQVKADARNRLFGYFFANPLAKHLKTDKQDFKQNYFVQGAISQMWNALHTWLSKEGYIIKSITPSESIFVRNALTDAVQKLLNMNEFKIFNPWLSYMQSKVLIQDQLGNVNATYADGSQKTTGTLGGEGEGDRVNVLGDLSGSALAEDDQGTEKASEQRRRVIALGITIDEFPSDPREGWIATEAKALVINSAHPMYKATEPFGSNSLMLNILRVIVSSLIVYKIPQSPDLTPEKVLEYQSKMITEAWTKVGEE